MARTTLALIACAAMFAATQVSAAEASLSSVKGDIVVGAGQGFSAAKAGGSLKAGDRIIARSGQARLAYADGCEVTIPAGGMATIGAKSPCAGGAGLIHAGDGSSAQLNFKKWPPQAYIAGLGVAVIVGSIIYGVTNSISE